MGKSSGAALPDHFVRGTDALIDTQCPCYTLLSRIWQAYVKHAEPAACKSVPSHYRIRLSNVTRRGRHASRAAAPRKMRSRGHERNSGRRNFIIHIYILSIYHAALYEQKAHLSSSADARSSGRERGCCSTASAKGADSQPASSSTARP